MIEKKLALSHAVRATTSANGWLKSASAGSNAWAVRSWKASDSVVLDAVPGAPTKLKRMVIRHVAEPSTQLLLLQKGRRRYRAQPQPRAAQARCAASRSSRITSKSQGTINYIAMNQNMPELAHPDVAQAVKWAIDYDAIAKNITPEIYETHQAFLPDGFPGRDQRQPVPPGCGQGEAR